MSLESTIHLIIIFWEWPKVIVGGREAYVIFLNSPEISSQKNESQPELLGPQFSVITRNPSVPEGIVETYICNSLRIKKIITRTKRRYFRTTRALYFCEDKNSL